MARAKPKKGGSVKGSGTSKVANVAKKGASLLGIGGKSVGKRSRKKSALFYAREIQRIKLKKKYERVKYGVGVR